MCKNVSHNSELHKHQLFNKTLFSLERLPIWPLNSNIHQFSERFYSNKVIIHSGIVLMDFLL